jgi:hypothetical protein
MTGLLRDFNTDLYKYISNERQYVIKQIPPFLSILVAWSIKSFDRLSALSLQDKRANGGEI